MDQYLPGDSHVARLCQRCTYVLLPLTGESISLQHVPRCPQPLLEPRDTQHSDFDMENSLTHYNSDFDHSKSHQHFGPARSHRFHQPSYSSSSSHNLTHGNRAAPGDLIAGPSYEDIVLQTSTVGRSISLERLRQSENETDMPVTEVDDGGVGEGRLRTPFEPPFTAFLPDHVNFRGNADIQNGLPNTQVVELGTPGEHELHNSQPRTPIGTAPPPVIVPVKGPTGKASWRVLCVPYGVLCSDQRMIEKERREITVRRRPPSLPVLHPAHRYCLHDQTVKPYRAHHCRNCGTVSRCLW